MTESSRGKVDKADKEGKNEGPFTLQRKIRQTRVLLVKLFENHETRTFGEIWSAVRAHADKSFTMEDLKLVLKMFEKEGNLEYKGSNVYRLVKEEKPVQALTGDGYMIDEQKEEYQLKDLVEVTSGPFKGTQGKIFDTVKLSENVVVVQFQGEGIFASHTERRAFHIANIKKIETVEKTDESEFKFSVGEDVIVFQEPHKFKGCVGKITKREVSASKNVYAVQFEGTGVFKGYFKSFWLYEKRLQSFSESILEGSAEEQEQEQEQAQTVYAKFRVGDRVLYLDSLNNAIEATVIDRDRALLLYTLSVVPRSKGGITQTVNGVKQEYLKPFIERPKSEVPPQSKVPPRGTSGWSFGKEIPGMINNFNDFRNTEELIQIAKAVESAVQVLKDKFLDEKHG